MWSGFFFYSPRPPSQKPALEFLTVLVVSVNVVYMLVLLYSMCSETCREHENNSVVKMFRRRTSSMKNVMVRTSSMMAVNSSVHRAGSVQHVQNPISEDMVEIEMSSRNNNSDGCYSIARPEVVPLSKNSGGETKKKNRAKNKTNKVNKRNKRNKTKSRKMHPNKQPAPKKKTAAQQERRKKLKSLHVKRQSLAAINDGSVLVEKEREIEAVSMNTHKRKSFLKIDDEEYGIYFQDAVTEETVWELPEDGDVVVKEDELQHNPMNRRSFNKIEDEEHGVYFQDAETEETVWELPENGLVL